MKRIIMVLVLMLCICGVSRADTLVIGDIIRNLDIKQGVAFSLADNQLNHLSTVEILEYNGFALEGGAAYDAEKTGIKAVAVVSYNLVNLKDIGVNVPILDMVSLRPGIYGGFGSVGAGNEFDYGISLSCISLSW